MKNMFVDKINSCIYICQSISQINRGIHVCRPVNSGTDVCRSKLIGSYNYIFFIKSVVMIMCVSEFLLLLFLW